MAAVAGPFCVGRRSRAELIGASLTAPRLAAAGVLLGDRLVQPPGRPVRVGSGRISLGGELEATPDMVPVARHDVIDTLTPAGLTDPGLPAHVALALTEATANAVRHA